MQAPSWIFSVCRYLAFMKLLLNSLPVRLSLVGIPATFVYVLLAYIAGEIHVYEPEAINRTGFLVALSASYFGHHHWTFERRIDRQFHLLRFSTLALTAYLFSRLITFIVIQVMGHDQAWAQVLIVLIVPGINSLVSKYWAAKCSLVDNLDATSWMSLGATASLLVAILVLTWLHGTSFNHDTSWFFVATHSWIDGASLYSGIMEINPPLLFYLTRVILEGGAIFAWSDENAMRVALFLLAGTSVFLTDKVFNAGLMAARQRAAMMVFGTVALLMIPLNSFGQREHLFVVFILPYLMTQAMRMAGNEVPVVLRSLCVIFALPGLLLKPYFLLLPVLLSLYETVRLRRAARMLSLENGLIAVASLAYLLFVNAWHPDYFKTVVPLGRLTYFAFGKSMEEILFDPLLLLLIPCSAPLMSRYFPKSNKSFSVTLLLASLATLVIYLVQFKGWYYHAVPYWVMTFLLAGWLLVSQIGTRNWVWSAISFVLVLKVVVITQIQQGPYLARAAGQLQHAMAGEAGNKLMVYTTNISHAFPLVNQAKLQWTSRYPTQWIVPGAFVGLQRIPVENTVARAPYEMALSYARRTAVEDFVRHRPDLVLVDVRRIKSYFYEHPFDWIDFLSQDPNFKQAWVNYDLVREIPNFQLWRLRDH
ncbi:GtrA-like protein [Hydrogenophaga sp. T4]|nr:GtrA-like protein [Hydrogenophaga sp. T4]